MTQKGQSPLCHFEKRHRGDCPFWATKKISEKILLNEIKLFYL